MRAIAFAAACAALVLVAVSVDADTPWSDAVTREFESRVSSQLAYVKRALAADRAPDLTAALAADNAAHHSYADKYVLTEYATNTAIAAVVQQWEALGLSAVQRDALIAAAQGTAADGSASGSGSGRSAPKTVTLRWSAHETCEYLRSQTRKVEGPTRVTEVSGILYGTHRVEDKVVTTVTDYFWRFDVTYELAFFTGTGDTADGDLRFSVRKRMPAGTRELVTSAKYTPRPQATAVGPFNVDVTWLLQQYQPRAQLTGAAAADSGTALVPAFTIDRSDANTCRTPRRNPQTEAAIAFWARLKSWNEQVHEYVSGAVQRDGSLAARNAVREQPSTVSTDRGVFVPILPLFDSLKPATNRRQPQPTAEPLTNAQTGGSTSAPASGSSASTNVSDSDAMPRSSDGAKTAVDIGSDDPSGTGAVPLGLVNEFLAYQKQTLHDRWNDIRVLLSSAGEPGSTVITEREVQLTLTLLHGAELCRAAVAAADSVEQMLYRQLQQALGRDLTPADVDAYAAHHLSRLYRPRYAPRPFSYAIRRPNAYPEGSLAIEARPSAAAGAAGVAAAERTDRAAVLPVNTIVARSVVRPPRTVRPLGAASADPLTGFANAPFGADADAAADTGDGDGDAADGDSDGAVYIALDATTRVAMYGERYVHGFVSQSFGGAPSPYDLHLVARAKEFSSFIVLCGRMTSRDAFDPQFGLIVQNREELQLPLWLETLPTAREFRDAIASLSPEQQRFAKGYRALQLQSTVFGVAVVQIKPALERVLNLPPHALTKEIELTQRIMRLLIDFQIPSDQIAFRPDTTTATTTAATGAATGATSATANPPSGATAGTGGATGGAVAAVVDTPQARVEAVRAQVQRLTELTERIVSANARPDADADANAEDRNRHVHECCPCRVNAAPLSPGCCRCGATGAKRTLPAAPRFEEVHGDAEMLPSFMEVQSHFQHISHVMAGAAQPAAAMADRLRFAAFKGPTPTPTPPAGAARPQAAADGTKPADPHHQQQQADADTATGDAEMQRGVDYTALPAALEAAYARYGLDAALRPTVIHTGNEWTRTRHSVIGLSAAEVAAARAAGSGASSAAVGGGAKGVEVVGREQQPLERARALDLLDALTRSGDGALPLVDAALHVVIAATHAFARSVVDTVVRDSRNPIEALERSSLVVAATIFDAVHPLTGRVRRPATATAATTGSTPAAPAVTVLPHQLVRPAQLPRLALYHPLLAPPLPAPPISASDSAAGAKASN